MLLEGKVALVTGASRGIGREIAISLANEGATVIVNYNGSKEKADAVVDEIIKAGGKAESIGCSVADFTGVENMISSVTEKYGKIDILVNNAGITRDGLLMKMSESDYDDVISTNLKGTFNCVRHVSRQMLKQRSGRIINISSVVGLSGNAGQANYASSKAGIIGLTKSAAKELASRGITVNAVAPGYVDTEMTQVLSDAVRENVLAQIPMKRMGNTKDIANVVVFLASDMAAYVTGQVLSVDGGMHI
ncbi:MAG: 3-oxoacyl-[acyl-carrier-protein] reductase [Bacteroides sp.]